MKPGQITTRPRNTPAMTGTTLKLFSGMNNRRVPSDLSYSDTDRRTRAFLRDARNVDLTASGTLVRRSGYSKVLPLDGCRSLWSDGAAMYFAAGTMLYRYDGAAAQPVADVATSTAEVSYVATPRGIAWSDGYRLRLLTPGGEEALAPPEPNPVPAITVSAGGALRAGDYFVAFAAVRAGLQSAMTVPISVTVPDQGKLTIATSPQAEDLRVFVAVAGASLLHLEAVLPAGQTTTEVALVRSTDLSTSFLPEAPMPPGHIVRLHRGRLLVANGAYVYASLPFQYGLMNPITGYVALDGEVTLLESVEDGVFVATAERTWFAPGGDFTNPDSFTAVLPFGAVPGTAVHDPLSNNVRWFSPRGLVEGTQSGQVALLQDDNLFFGPAAGGASVVREQFGHRSVLTALRGATPPGTAISSSFMDAEIFKE